MTELLFYEKPGCAGNRRQQALLKDQGVSLQVKDLLREPWAVEDLRAFFANQPVARWFNTTAPAVKSGEIQPERLDAEQALALMMADPILIRRPLLAWGDLKQSGFEKGPVLDALGIDLSADKDLDGCPATLDMSRCQQGGP